MSSPYRQGSGRGRNEPLRWWPGHKPKRRRRLHPEERRAERLRLAGRALYWCAIAGVWAALVLGGVTLWYVSTMPDPMVAGLDKRTPNITVVADDGTVLAERGMRRGYIRLKHLPPYLVNAVLATEDRRFRLHPGVDPVGLARAMVKNAMAGAVVEGGSTITQQLAKNLFLTSDRTIARKAKEMVLALWLERRYSKDKILELYLNRVYFGAGAYGVEAAAQTYFGKSARQVTMAEAALLAGLLKAPSRYAPTSSPRRAEERAAVVVANMVDAGMLSQAEAMAAFAQPVVVRNPGSGTGYEYAVDWVAELLPQLAGSLQGDLIVETTVDARLQRSVHAAVGRTMDAQGAARNAGQAAVVVLDRHGGIKALTGGTSYKRSPFNRAVKAMRQPGSAFKPFVYLAALESGLTPDTITVDEPVSVEGWRPKNHDGKYKGAVTLRDGLAQSINTVAVRLTMGVGRWRVLKAARRLGITAPLHDSPSIALGTAEVTLLELTSAYAPFANGGYAAAPYIVERVRDARGRVLWERRAPRTVRVAALPQVGAMNEMMNAALIEGTGRRAALPEHPAGGKTGTSQDFRDAWFVGYTAHYVAGVWVGNDDGAPMKGVTGGSIPSAIWKQVMVQAHAGIRSAALPGTRVPAFALRSLPPRAEPARLDDSFLKRVLGIFSPSG